MGKAIAIPVGHLPTGTGWQHSSAMAEEQIFDVRLRRLRQLIAQDFKDKPKSAIAEDLGVEPSYLSRMLGKKNRKRIGEGIARDIERRRNLPRYWLDAADEGVEQHRMPEPMKLFGMIVTREAVEFASEWQKLPEALRDQVAALVTLMVAQQVRSNRRPKAPDHSKTTRQHSKSDSV
jgi:hypothetical protein